MLRQELTALRLEFGDTLLLLGTDTAIDNLRGDEDILVIDRPHTHPLARRPKMLLALGVIAAVVAGAASGAVPIVLFLGGCLKPQEGYQAVQWDLMFLIFGMLALGEAMQRTGTSQYFAEKLLNLVSSLGFGAYRPLAMLACVYLLTSLLTEILSNNAAAVLSATVAIGIARVLGVNSRPFIVAVAMAASASFATPIGYQTNAAQDPVLRHQCCPDSAALAFLRTANLANPRQRQLRFRGLPQIISFPQISLIYPDFFFRPFMVKNQAEG